MRRTTLASERRRLKSENEDRGEFFADDNERVRLQINEEVHLGAIVLNEVFTPSTIDDLYRAIDSWPMTPAAYREQVKDRVRRWRSESGYGAWQSVVVFKHPDAGFLGSTVVDSRMPPEFQAVHLLLSMASPSVTVLTAAFVPFEEHGDMTEILSRDFDGQVRNVRIRVSGALSGIRQRIPWSRAKRASYSMHIAYPHVLKKEACGARLDHLEASAWNWLQRTALGRFGHVQLGSRPSIKLFITDGIEPFGDRRSPLECVGLDYASELWNTRDRDAYYFCRGQSDGWNKPRSGVIAASRTHFNSVTGGDLESGIGSTFGMVDQFVRNHTGLFSTWALGELCAVYRQEITTVRDTISRERTAIGTAKRLNGFLWADGTDIAVIARELTGITNDQGHYGFSIDRLIDTERLRDCSDDEDASEENPEVLGEFLRKRIQAEASEIENQYDTAVQAISSSSQLLQSISDIHLQRATVSFSMFAAVLAIIALFKGG